MSRFTKIARWLVAACAGVVSLGSVGQAADEPVDYLKQIKPVLVERCVACHGARKQKGGLRLDTAALAIKGGESGTAIRPGDADASLLLKRVMATDEPDTNNSPTA